MRLVGAVDGKLKLGYMNKLSSHFSSSYVWRFINLSLMCTIIDKFCWFFNDCIMCSCVVVVDRFMYCKSVKVHKWLATALNDDL